MGVVVEIYRNTHTQTISSCMNSYLATVLLFLSHAIVQPKHFLIEIDDNHHGGKQPEPVPSGVGDRNDLIGYPWENPLDGKKCLNGLVPNYPPGERPPMEENEDCDDGKHNLERDWDPKDSTPYTCTGDELSPKSKKPKLECDYMPPGYEPPHYCMDNCINYNRTIPTHDGHRPLWGLWGTYKYIPRQRWLHNIEHGTVVMLYHPCANTEEVEKLKKQVRGCLRKHVITPDITMPEETPLVLVAWGCRLLMTHFDEFQVVKFIKEKALHGPGGTDPRDGSWDLGLLEQSKTVKGSDYNDTNLCPEHTRISDQL